MYVGLKQPHADGEHYVTPALAIAKETKQSPILLKKLRLTSKESHVVWHEIDEWTQKCK